MKPESYVRENEDGSTDTMVKIAEHVYVNLCYRELKTQIRAGFVSRKKTNHGRVKVINPNKWRAPAAHKSRTPIFYIDTLRWKQLTAPPLKRASNPLAQDINMATREQEERNLGLRRPPAALATVARRLEAKFAAQRYWWAVSPRSHQEVRQAADCAVGRYYARRFVPPSLPPCKGGTFETDDLDQWARDNGPARKRRGRPYIRTDTTERQDWLAAFDRRWTATELYGPIWFRVQRWCVFKVGKPVYLGGRHGDLECPPGLRCANSWPFYRMLQHGQLAPDNARLNEDLYSAGYRYLTDWHLRLRRDDRWRSYGEARKDLGGLAAVIEPIVCQDAPAGSLTHLSRYHNRTRAVDEIMIRLREGLRVLAEHYDIIPLPLTANQISARRAAEYRRLDMERGQQALEAGRMRVEQGREMSLNRLSVGNQSFGVQENINNINGRGTKLGQYDILDVGSKKPPHGSDEPSGGALIAP